MLCLVRADSVVIPLQRYHRGCTSVTCPLVHPLLKKCPWGGGHRCGRKEHWLCHHLDLKQMTCPICIIFLMCKSRMVPRLLGHMGWIKEMVSTKLLDGMWQLCSLKYNSHLQKGGEARETTETEQGSWKIYCGPLARCSGPAGGCSCF